MISTWQWASKGHTHSWEDCKRGWGVGGGWSRIAFGVFSCGLSPYVSVWGVTLLFDEGLRSLKCLGALFGIGILSLETRVSKEAHVTNGGGNK